MIKARVNKKMDDYCRECGAKRDECLDLFDIKMLDKKITLCDNCIDDLFYKCLGCGQYTRHRVKSPKDMKIIRQRNSWKDKLDGKV